MEATADHQGSSPAPGTARRLVRRRHDRVIAGVASGLGDYFGVDPVIFRLVFVATAIAGGTGLIAYLAAWLLIPEAPEGDQPPRAALQAPERPQAWIGVALLVVGAAMLFGQVGWWGPEVLWGLALIGVGVLLFRNDHERRSRPAPPASPPPPTPGGEGPPDPEAPAGDPGGAAAARQADPTAQTAALWPSSAGPPAAAARRPREHSMLGWVTVGAALVVMGVVALLSQRDAIALAGDQVLALGLGVVGLGLLVGAWLGRARWLILIGVLLVPPILAANAVDVPMSAGTGDRLYTPRTAAQLRPDYELFAGQMILDLSRLPLARSTQVHAKVGAGRIEVRVPRGATTSVSADVELGEVSLFGTRQGGNDLTVTRSRGTGDEVLELDLESSVGEVVVVEVPSRIAPPRADADKTTDTKKNEKGRSR
jgi:phage shock protein PspC (stress-responsive transcriptional regulator)